MNKIAVFSQSYGKGMTIGELIRILQKYDSDTELLIYNDKKCNYQTISHLAEIYTDNHEIERICRTEFTFDYTAEDFEKLVDFIAYCVEEYNTDIEQLAFGINLLMDKYSITADEIIEDYTAEEILEEVEDYWRR